jgi:DNA-binding NtrC family response regulator
MTPNSTSSRPRNGLSVLLVDSAEPDARLMASAMDRAGHLPIVATSGAEAIRLLDSRRFDLAIVDEYLVGVVNSAAVVRKAGSVVPEVPVILTGLAGDAAARSEALRPRNVSSFLPKPLDARRLQAEVEEVIVTLGDPARAPDAADRPLAPSSSSPMRSTVPPPYRARRGEVADGDLGVAVMIVERDAAIRDAVVAALAAIGCRVAAFASPARAAEHVRCAGYGVLVARADIIEANQHWRQLSGDQRPLGAIAIAETGDADERVRAAYLGARGVFEPPYDAARIAHDFQQALAIMRDEIRRRSSAPPTANL